MNKTNEAVFKLSVASQKNHQRLLPVSGPLATDFGAWKSERRRTYRGSFDFTCSSIDFQKVCLILLNSVCIDEKQTQSRGINFSNKKKVTNWPTTLQSKIKQLGIHHPKVAGQGVENSLLWTDTPWKLRKQKFLLCVTGNQQALFWSHEMTYCRFSSANNLQAHEVQYWQFILERFEYTNKSVGSI